MLIRESDLLRIKAETAVITSVERTGFAVDVPYCRTTRDKAEADLAEVQDGLNQYATINWNSAQQVALFLHNDLGLRKSPVCRKGKVKRDKTSTDATAVQWLATRYPDYKDLFSRMLQAKRIQSSLKYLKKLPQHIGSDGLVHPVVGATSDDDTRFGAVTGRWGLKNPEMSQLPKDARKDAYGVRKAITGTPGEVLLVADQKQLEVVVLAHIATRLFGNVGVDLANALLPGAPDFHSTNARKVFGDYLQRQHTDGRPLASIPLDAWNTDPYLQLMRGDVKAVWYGLMYGKEAYGFGHSLLGVDGMPIGEEAAAPLVDALRNAVPALGLWREWVENQLRTQGYITTLAGRVADFRATMRAGTEYEQAAAIRKALNFPMQGGGADIMLGVMVAVTRCPKLKKLGFRLMLQVHDEIVLRGPAENAEEAAEVVNKHMTQSVKLTLPLQTSVNYGINYYEAK